METPLRGEEIVERVYHYDELAPLASDPDNVDTLLPRAPDFPSNSQLSQGFAKFSTAAWFLANGLLLSCSMGLHLTPNPEKSVLTSSPQVVLLNPDGIPMDPAAVLRKGEAFPDRLQVGPDPLMGPVPCDATGIMLKNENGRSYVVPHGAENTVYAQVVNLVVSSTAETRPLAAQNPERYAAVLNARVVETSFPKAKRWDELMDNIQDTEEAYRVLVGMLGDWGGYEAVLTAVELENAAREEHGEALIAKPSALLKWIAEDSDLPHPEPVALKIAMEASLIDHEAVAKNLSTVDRRLADGRARIPSLAQALTAEDFKPLPSSSFSPLNSLGVNKKTTSKFGVSPRALTSSHEIPEPRNVSLERASAWKETHPSRQENSAAMEVSTQQWQASLLRLSNFVVEAKEPKGSLKKMARGENRKVMDGVLNKFLAHLDERIREPGVKTLEELREQSLQIKNYFFNECLSLLNRVHGHYSEYLRVFASNVMKQLAGAYEALLAREGIEGAQADVHASVLATLPAGFFKAS